MTLIARHRLCFYRRRCMPAARPEGNRSYAIVGEQDFPWAHPVALRHATIYHARFRQGHRALLGRVDGEPVFTAWIAVRSLRVDECAWTCTIADTEAVVYDCVTAVDWRGQGIYPEALRELSALLAGEGILHLWIYADARNAASRRGIEHASFDFLGEIRAWTVAGMTRRRGHVPGLYP